MNKQVKYRERHKLEIAATSKAWRKNNAHKRRAHKLLRDAVISGVVIKPTICQRCGASPRLLHGHHPDYSLPLDVLWICPKCHSAIHGVCVGAIRTFHRGEKHGRAKLTETNVADIRVRCQQGQAKRALAREFGVSEKLVRLIMKGEIWT